MKIKSDMRQVTGDKKRHSTRNGLVAACRPSRVTRHSENGIALIITLILLSVTLVMALAFLAISNRERSSVTTAADTTTARLAADDALAKAEAQIIATVYATTNASNYGLLISTNYINPNGFITTPAASYISPTNVSYVYPDGTPLSPADFLQNVSNLFFLPRAPVFVVTNQQTGSNEFRYYLDLNRDGQFEDTRSDEPNVNNLGVTNGTLAEIGDPQWVGVLERPDAPHGPDNYFLSRYAFIALPAGNELDLNAIHNQALNASLTALDGYFRNQGVGSWEINLAAFLADLNTNEWGQIVGSGPGAPGGSATYYQYNQIGNANSGHAFEDAYALLKYRYNTNSLPLAGAYFANGTVADGTVDMFTFASLMTNTAVSYYNYSMNNSWSGADNTNHYFDVTSDLFDKAKTQINVTPPTFGFTDRLLDADTNTLGGTTVPTYDRYTFYRLLAQLGTDSGPEQNKINLNYSNAVAYTDDLGIVTNIVVFPNAETNLVPWQPAQFFTIAADRMLRDYTTRWFQTDPTNFLRTLYGFIPTNYVDGTGFGVTNAIFGMTNEIPAFGITNIPVQMNGAFVYSPAVQRVLQLAANIYDATTNRGVPPFYKDYPSVFRPVFEHDNLDNVFIVGYAPLSSVNGPNTISGDADQQLALPYDITNLFGLSPDYTPIKDAGGYVNVYGVPWIIGAKKGFPNFNEFSMESVVQVTRKLLLSRTNSTGAVFGGGPSYKMTGTNQMYIMAVTNYLGVECWNSYRNPYTNAEIVVRDNFSVELTNDLGYLGGPVTYVTSAVTNIVIWPGWTNSNPPTPNSTSFVLPFGNKGTNFSVLPTAIYRFGANDFDNAILSPTPAYENYPVAPLPQFGLLTTNRLQVFMLDNGHVIDYAHFNGPDQIRNLNNELADPDASGGDQAYLWSTNLNGTVPWGVINQINVSSGTLKLAVPTDGSQWGNPPGLPPALRGNPGAIQEYFLGFLSPGGNYSFGGKSYINTNYVMQAPYTPTRTMVDYVSWQANDPLVHYLASDLNYNGTEPSSKLITGLTTWDAASPDILPDLGQVNQTYQPWGKAHSYTNADNNPFNTAYRDPLVIDSDNWDFPSDKLPTVGWLGRVHRGTPWQTVYLKASNILKAGNGLTTWADWTGNTTRFEATNTAPVQDRALFDIFSTALNDNATRGQMSVNTGANNQPSLAAWSALFSGIAVPTSLTNTYQIINPAGVDQLASPLYQVVTNINYTRANFTNADGVAGSFERVGDILSVAALTEQSPFLAGRSITNGISDALEEWLPQQTLSLLRVSSAPRYVIYCFGQTLKPAPDGVVTSGPFFGMVTNYQVVAETATRAVIQVQPVMTKEPGGILHTNYAAKIEQMNVLPPN
jgi:hypothetical protein